MSNKNFDFPGTRLLLFLLPLLPGLSCRNDGVKPQGNEQAVPVYNQAYQENYEADKVEDILQQARGAYVLLDPFEDDVFSFVAAVKAEGNEVGGYISIGTGEDWRQDFALLQPYLVSVPWGQWAGEYFVNETTTGIVELMKARIDSLAAWGCDWVEFDNMDWAFDDELRAEYGFQTTAEEAIAYFNELCDYVHQKGMKCMAKNTVEGAGGFDGVLYESYNNDKNWWDEAGAKSFLEAGKLVIINHYNEKDCDKVYEDYMDLYGQGISYICEDRNLKKYVHYNE